MAAGQVNRLLEPPPRADSIHAAIRCEGPLWHVSMLADGWTWTAVAPTREIALAICWAAVRGAILTRRCRRAAKG